MRIERTPRGEFRLRLPREERRLLRTVSAELLVMLDADPDDPDLRRLFPPAYGDDPEAEAQYRLLVGEGLAAGRARALETVRETAARDLLTAEEANAWLTALNDARLVLGTRLDVSEEMDWDVDPDDPRAPHLAVYAYLSWLQEQLVAALAGAVEPELL